MTEEKPKILKKVEELSGHLAEFMDNCDSIDKVMMPSLVDKDQVLFWPDFLVDPDPRDCTCFYGGEKLHCTKNTTKREDYADHFKVLPENLFPNCVVRKYADTYKSAMKFLEEKE